MSATIRHIVLCGGVGNRLKAEVALPKPLGLVLGIPLIQHVLPSIPSNEISLIAGKHLKPFNFESIIHHLTEKNIDFTYLRRPTRGPIETAYLGLKNLQSIGDDDPIILYDNDTIYHGIELPNKPCNSIGYSTIPDPSKSYQYCFLDIKNQEILDIYEKNQITNDYAAGIYMFESKKLFMEKAEKLIKTNLTEELFISSLFKTLLEDISKPVHAFKVGSGICLGTVDDVSENITKVPFRKLRICFDLDNTLLKYRLPKETYIDCKPIHEMVDLLKMLHEMGHCIIIHTARGMATANQNNGAAMKRVAFDTFKVLNEYKIPFDEIYFGKPNADVYVDDKSHNPFIHLYKSIGFVHLETPIHNPTNKFNNLFIDEDVVTKTGPSSSMAGEVFFYKSINGTDIEKYFPKYLGSTQDAISTKLHLKYINGSILYNLLEDELFDTNHLDLLIGALNDIHSYKKDINIKSTDLYENYMGKLKRRVQNPIDYPFSNKEIFMNKIDNIISKYLNSPMLSIGGVVLGDPWFSNTMLDLKSNIIFLDMKGDISGQLTTNGDVLTDFCKLLQSLYGFDSIVNNSKPNEQYLKRLRRYLINHLITRGYTEEIINAVTACLIAKTISFFDDSSPHKTPIWDIANSLI